MKSSTNILDIVTLAICTVILSILFNGVILLIGATYLAYKAYTSYKAFLQITGQETVNEAILLDDIAILSNKVAAKVQIVLDNRKAKNEIEIDWLPYQLGLNF